MDGVKERKLLLGTRLEEGTFLGLSGTSVRVAFAPEHTFHKTMLELKENRDILSQEFEKQFGRGAALACVVGDSHAAAVAAERLREELYAEVVTGGEPGAAPAPAVEPKVRAEDSAPSIVQRIVEIFDGEILDLSGGRRAGKGSRMNIQAMLKKAQALQAKMTQVQEELKAKELIGSSGGGKVKADERRAGGDRHLHRPRSREGGRGRSPGGPGPGRLPRRAREGHEDGRRGDVQGHVGIGLSAGTPRSRCSTPPPSSRPSSPS